MPGSNFDAMQAAMFEAVKTQFAVPATWTAANMSETWTGLVLFKNPSQKAAINGFAEYDPNRWSMEYKAGDMVGLKALVDTRQTQEVVNVDGFEYYVTSVHSIFDGRTFVAYLQPIDND